jgi:hypothetical protein
MPAENSFSSFVIPYFSCAFCIITLSWLLIANVQKEHTTFICKGWRGRQLFFFGTSVNNNLTTQLSRSDDVPQLQRYGNLKSYISIVSIAFNYKYVSLKLQHSSRKGETALKYTYTIMAAATLLAQSWKYFCSMKLKYSSIYV